MINMTSWNGNIALALATVQVVLTIYIRSVCTSYIPLIVAAGHLLAIGFLLDSKQDTSILQWATRLTVVVGGTSFVVFSLDDCGYQAYGAGLARIIIELILTIFEADVIAMQWVALARQTRSEQPIDIEMMTKGD